MSLRHDWESIPFSDAQVTKAKRQPEYRYNNLEPRQTRWTGYLGEMAAHGLFQTNAIWDSVWQTDEREGYWPVDISLATLQAQYEIDVKTMAVNYFPHPSYHCNVNASQWEKIKKEGEVDTLVFSHFVLGTNTCVLLGWLFVSEFESVAFFKKKGSQNDKIIINSDVYCVKIEKLRPIYDL